MGRLIEIVVVAILALSMLYLGFVYRGTFDSAVFLIQTCGIPPTVAFVRADGKVDLHRIPPKGTSQYDIDLQRLTKIPTESSILFLGKCPEAPLKVY